MNRIPGRCLVGRHINRGEYVILRFAGISGVGPALIFDAEEFHRNGLLLLVNAIESSYEASGVRPRLAELLALKRKHTIARICLTDNHPQKFELMPLHSGRGWRFAEWPEEIRSVGAKVTNRYFMKALDEALDIAS